MEFFRNGWQLDEQEFLLCVIISANIIIIVVFRMYDYTHICSCQLISKSFSADMLNCLLLDF